MATAATFEAINVDHQRGAEMNGLGALGSGPGLVLATLWKKLPCVARFTFWRLRFPFRCSARPRLRGLLVLPGRTLSRAGSH